MQISAWNMQKAADKYLPDLKEGGLVLIDSDYVAVLLAVS